MSYRNQDPANFCREEADENGNEPPKPRTSLTYSWMSWSNLPTDFIVGTLEHVTRLDLDDNQLTELPSYLVNSLPNLEELSMARNQLTKLPDNLGDWTQLWTISVPGNLIKSLPISIGKMICLDYLNMEKNPLVSPLDKLVSAGKVWDVDGCTEFAHQVYEMANQVQYATTQTRRNMLHVAQYGPKKPPMMATLDSKPYGRSAIPQLIRQENVTEERAEVRALGLKPLVFKPLKKIRTDLPQPRVKKILFKRKEPEAPVTPQRPPFVTRIPKAWMTRKTPPTPQPEPPIVANASEPKAPTIKPALPLTSQQPDPMALDSVSYDPVLEEKQLDQDLDTPSEVFDTKSWVVEEERDFNKNESEMSVGLASKTSIAVCFKESVTGISATKSDTEVQPKRVSVWFQAAMALAVACIELVKIGTYACCLFGLLVGLASIFVDDGILLEFLARPWVNFFLPDWFQLVFVRHHQLAFTHLFAYCAHLPLYRSAPKGMVVIIITWVYATFYSVLGLFTPVQQ